MNSIRQIGLACKQYAIDHDGRFPDRISQLQTDNYLSPGKIDICPSAVFPQESLTAENVDRLASYVILQGLTEAADPEQALVIEKWGSHKGQGGNVFRVGGQAGWVPAGTKIKRPAALPPIPQINIK